MRRFSAYAKAQSRSKHGELDFLQQSPILSQIKESVSKDITQSNAELIKQTTKRLSVSDGVKHLAAAVGERQYNKIEAIFTAVPLLSRRPVAMRLLVKAYCEQSDFVSARAVVNSSLDKIGDIGVQRYVAHLTFSARNAGLIEDAFNRLCSYHKSQGTEISVEVVASILNGLLFLESRPAFERVWKATSTNFWEPSLKSTTLLTKVLDAMLTENFGLARKLWSIAAGMNNFVFKESMRIWFVALRYFLVDNPNVDAVNSVTRLMQQCGASVGPKFTAIILRHLSSNYYSASPIEWLKYAKERNYIIGSTSVEVVVHNFAKRFPYEIGVKLKERANERLEYLGILEKHRHSLGEGQRHSDFLKNIKRFLKPSDILIELKKLTKRGLCLPYSHYTAAFQCICIHRNFTPDDLIPLIDMFKEQEFNIHCAVTDLAILERRCKLVFKGHGQGPDSSNFCRRLVEEYLIQYPLVSLDLSKRTRLANLALFSVRDPNLANNIADSLRLEQQRGSSAKGGFTSSNHDSASLQVMLLCKGQLSQHITPLVRNIVMENDGIYLDKEFKETVKKLLRKNAEPLDVLSEIDDSNSRLETAALQMVEDAVSYYRLTSPVHT